MDFINIEKKWQKHWADTGLYKFDTKSEKQKYYVLEMFSYPSAANLHAGHWYNYGPTDSFARFKRMQGYNVFHPMGFDAFGLPAENHAIKTGQHPEAETLKNIKYMQGQLRAIGASYDWDYELITCLPDYYRWTQQIFLDLYKAGLAYRKEAPVNWCTSCSTVLANEQVVDGECERCKSVVIRKNLVQWFFKITDYADELLYGLDNLDWPEKTKAMQRNWIGRSQGAEVEFELVNSSKTANQAKSFKVFTTRIDTLFGVSYCVIAPESPLVKQITTAEQLAAVEEYIARAAQASEIERMSTTREKTGVFTGAYAINPINGEQVPVWISDYVLATYGTGCVMGVPAHDERDFVFATKYGLDIKFVIKKDKAAAEPTSLPEPVLEDGILYASGAFNGLDSADAREKIANALEAKSQGRSRTNYRLRDWLVSRQRYWGCPIPIIHCEKCGEVPVADSDLPVLLPRDVDFIPDGQSPLLKSKTFMNVKCPKCGIAAKRDADTLDTFVCSSWYFLRYPDNKNEKSAFDKDVVNKLLPVDKYVGGAEHAVLHLLYARFFTKAMRDMGKLNFDEPFISLVHQGVILGEDGQKMSKSVGNVVNPNDFVDKFGSDAFRMYLMFGFNYVEGGPWNANGIDSIVRFLERVAKLSSGARLATATGTPNKELAFIQANTIKSVTADLEKMQFNTAIARIMEFVNALSKAKGDGATDAKYLDSCIVNLVKLIAPFAPHFAEELWESIGGKGSIHNQNYPAFCEADLVKDEHELAVQINSKNKGFITIKTTATNQEIESAAKAELGAKLDDMTVKKVIVIPKRLVNFVV